MTQIIFIELITAFRSLKEEGKIRKDNDATFGNDPTAQRKLAEKKNRYTISNFTRKKFDLWPNVFPISSSQMGEYFYYAK